MAHILLRACQQHLRNLLVGKDASTIKLLEVSESIKSQVPAAITGGIGIVPAIGNEYCQPVRY
jgi:hypothetical protein